MTAEDRYCWTDTARVALIGETGVILDVSQGKYYSLSPVAVQICRLLAEGRSVAEMTEELAGAFDMPKSTLAEDMRSFLALLERAKLCRIAGEEAK